MTTISVQDYTVMAAADLGAMIPSTYTQVGALITHYYRQPLGEEERTYAGVESEAILQTREGDFVAVEMHKGVAFIAEVRDEGLLDTIRSYLASATPEEFCPEEGRVFQLQQEVTLKQEELGESVREDS